MQFSEFQTIEVNKNEFEVVKQILTQTHIIKYLELKYANDVSVPRHLTSIHFFNQSVLKDYKSLLLQVPKRLMVKQLETLSSEKALFFDFSLNKTLASASSKQLNEEKQVSVILNITRKLIKLNSAGIYLIHLDLDDVLVESGNFFIKKSKIIESPGIRLMIKPFQYLTLNIKNISDYQIIEKLKNKKKQKNLVAGLFCQLATSANLLNSSSIDEEYLIRTQKELTLLGYSTEFIHLILEIMQPDNPILEDLEDVKEFIRSYRDSKESLLMDSVKIHESLKKHEIHEVSLKFPFKVIKVSTQSLVFKVLMPNDATFKQSKGLSILYKSIDTKYSKHHISKGLYDTIKTERNSLLSSTMERKEGLVFSSRPRNYFEHIDSTHQNLSLDSTSGLKKSELYVNSFKFNDFSAIRKDSSKNLASETTRSLNFSQSLEKNLRFKSLGSVKNAEKNRKNQVCGVCCKGGDLIQLNCSHHYHQKCLTISAEGQVLDELYCFICFAPVERSKF